MERRRMNWGCGRVTPEGWINSDSCYSPGVDIACDILAGLPLEDDSLDYVVSMHALPEIAYSNIEDALWELRRVIRPGGVLRLGLPDMDRAIHAYQRKDRDYFLIPDHVCESIGGKMIVQLIWYGRSRTMFTSDFIEELLHGSGFREVHHCEYLKTHSPYPDIIELDNRPQESLFIEGVK